ncbi:FMN-dependent NADH-azoreductase [Caenimonas sp. S4]|nr:FMN-dependent NADH-azoreductase [Caenimonas soli]
MKLLHVDASVTGAQSVSRELSSAVVEAWRASEPGLQLVYRDLARTVPPQLTEAALKVIKFGAEPSADTPARDLAFMEELLVEFLTADAVVIGAPMYNFTVPTQLKGWLDALAQPGRTFAYTPQGPKGLATGKRVIIASARGGSYSQPPMNARDFQEPYLIAVLNFMGITDIEVVRAEGVNMPGRRDGSIEQARRDISVLFGVAQAAPVAA